MERTSEFYSKIGKKGAEAFWNRFRNDPEFRKKMRDSWKGHRVNYKKIIEAAKLGSKAFRQRYNTDKEFKRIMDEKLAKSRSKGGSISLKNLGEDDFKKRLEGMKNELVKHKYTDKFGNKFRSLLELKVANFLASNGINYMVEPRFEIGYHAYYPDFLIPNGEPKIIEVMGIGTEKYWKNAARKIGLLLKRQPRLRIAVITSFLKLARKYLDGMPRVYILRWSELNELAVWCRDNTPG
ncbi:MAG: hypothetical protein ACUVUF_07170 [Candidatus Bathycorpusculaceae bacterium]